MIQKYLITLLIAFGIAFALYSNFNYKQHGDSEKWMRNHGVIALRRGNIDKLCIECHEEKRKQNKSNFCNNCHLSKNIKPVK